MSQDIPLKDITPDPEQPRRHFAREDIEGLAASLAADGLAVPIAVRPEGKQYVIIHGERRYRAALSLGWKTIRAEVRDIDADAAWWLALVENVQRADLTPLEEAEAYQKALSKGLTQTALAKRIGKTQSYIAQKLRLLTLPEPIAVLVRSGKLTEAHARQLLRIRKFYGENITRSLRPESAGGTRDMFKDGCFVFAYLNMTRPEDAPAGVHWPQAIEDKADSTIAGAVAAMWDYMEARDFQPEQWVVAALWWGCFAVQEGLTVAALDAALDGWEARVYAAVFWCHWFKQSGQERPRGNMTPEDRVLLREYWGYRSDLRHGGIADWADNPPDDVLERAKASVREQQSIISPSSCQPWGQNHKEHTADLDLIPIEAEDAKQ